MNFRDLLDNFISCQLKLRTVFRLSHKKYETDYEATATQTLIS